MIVNKIHLSSTLEKVEEQMPSLSQRLRSRLRKSLAQMLSPREMTFEEWERLERKHTPHSSHHAQIYFRDRGF